MKLRIKFGDREFEFEDSQPSDIDDIVEISNLGRALLLQARPNEGTEADEVVEVTARAPLGFGPNPVVEADEDEYDEEEDEDG